MTWISLVCLLALSSSAFGRSVSLFGDNYGSPLILEPTMPTIITRDLPPVQQGYGGTRDLPPIQQGYGGTRDLPPVQQGYGGTRDLPPVQQGYGGTRDLPMISPPEIIPEPRAPYGYGSSIVPQPITRTLPVQNYGSSRMLDNYGSPTIRIIDVVETQADILCRGQPTATVIPVDGNRGFVTCLEPGKGVEQHCPKNLWFHETSRRCERTLGPLPDPCLSQLCLNGGQCVSTDSSTWECRCASGFDGTFCELDASYCQINQPCGPGAICKSFRLGAALDHMCIFEEGRSYGLNPSIRDVHPCKDVDGPQKLSVTNAGFMICDNGDAHFFSCPGGTLWDDFNKACSWPDKPTVPESGSYGYGGQVTPPAPKTFTQSYGYGSQVPLPPPVPKTFTQSYGYGSQVPLPPPPPPPQVPKTFTHSYGYGSQVPLPPPPPPPQVPKTFTQSYGYGTSMIPQLPKVLPKSVSSYGYGSKLVLPAPTRSYSGYGGEVIEPKDIKVSGY